MRKEEIEKCKKNNLRRIISFSLIFNISYIIFALAGCSYVFSGGASGRVVDAESTSNPKDGIADVDVYAYTSSGSRDSDFEKWEGAERFSPSSYHSHTTTDANGNFRISKVVWETRKSSFGKDADVTTIYLLFYHENYGLVKGSAMIVSDSTSDNVYQEMTKIKKTTTLNISIIDVSNNAPTTTPVLVTVTVPQKGIAGSDETKKYTATITGNGVVQVTYPRFLSEDDKSNQTENEPTVQITYEQNSDNITWKACENGGTSGNDFSFKSSSLISQKISGNTYQLSLYGKRTELQMPTISGQYKKSGDEKDDGVVISMKQKDASGNYTIDCGTVTTHAETIGTSGTQSHGNFSGLGAGVTWKNETYPGKYTTTEVEISVDGTAKTPMTVRSDVANYNVQLN